MKNFISLENKNNSYLALLQLINKHFWKSKIGPLSALCMPLFFMIIYKIISSNRTDNLFENGFSSYLTFGILPLCLISLPQIIVDLKNSIILRKISVSNITSIKFCLLLLTYFLIALIFTVLIIITVFSIFLNVAASQFFKKIHLWEFIFVIITIFLSSLSVGLLMGVIIKRSNLVQISGVIILLVSSSFSGQLIPITVLGSSKAMRFIPLFSPLSYSLSLLNNVLIKSNTQDLLKLPTLPSIQPSYIKELISAAEYTSIFDLKHDFISLKIRIGIENKVPTIFEASSIIIYTTWQKALNLIMPFVICSLMFGLSIWKFNWTSR